MCEEIEVRRDGGNRLVGKIKIKTEVRERKVVDLRFFSRGCCLRLECFLGNSYIGW